MKHVFIAGCLFLALAVSAADVLIYHDGWIDLNKNGRMDVYENPSQPVAERVADLMKRMTLEEKIGQLWQPHMDSDADKTFAGRLRRGAVGSFLDGSALIETPAHAEQAAAHCRRAKPAGHSAHFRA